MNQALHGIAPPLAVLFDKDGTLLDFDRTWSRINREAADHAAGGNAELADRLLRLAGQDPATGKTAGGSLLAAGNAADVSRAWVAAGAPFFPENLTGDLDRIFAGGMRAAIPLTGVRAALERLKKRNIRLGLATSDSEASARIFLETLEATDLFDFIAGYDSGHGPKPEPGMLLAFAARLDLPPKAIAMVGDNTHDLELARNAGAGLAVGVLSGTGTRAALEPLADVLLNSVSDLPEFLAQ